MRNKAVSTYPSVIQFVHECYKFQKMCSKSVDFYLLALKPVVGCFFTINKILDNAVFSNEYIVFGNIDSNLLHSLAMI